MATLTPATAAAPAETADRGRPRNPRLDSERLFNRVTLGALIALALLWLAPLAWAVATSVRPPDELATDPTAWISDNPTLANYREVLGAGRIPYWYLNSFVTSALTTLLTVCTASLAAFALSRLRFRYRRPVFLLILAGVMIPPQLLMIPHFQTLQVTGMLNTYWAVILPQVPNVVSVFVFKQFFDGLPRDFEEAARIDGAGFWTIYRSVVLPLSRPVIGAISIITFVDVWNNLILPLYVLSNPKLMTIPVGLATVQGSFGQRLSDIQASAILGALPLVILFLIF